MFSMCRGRRRPRPPGAETAGLSQQVVPSHLQFPAQILARAVVFVVRVPKVDDKRSVPLSGDHVARAEVLVSDAGAMDLPETIVELMPATI
jgi:hypothetical protein